MKRFAIAIAAAAVLATPAMAADFEFTYKPSAPAPETYQDLENAAERHCKTWGRKSLIQRRAEIRCYDTVLDQVVLAIGDQQMAVLHDAVKRGERPNQLALAQRAPRL